jgi:hypothetical protein
MRPVLGVSDARLRLDFVGRAGLGLTVKFHLRPTGLELPVDVCH